MPKFNKQVQVWQPVGPTTEIAEPLMGAEGYSLNYAVFGIQGGGYGPQGEIFTDIGSLYDNWITGRSDQKFISFPSLFYDYNRRVHAARNLDNSNLENNVRISLFFSNFYVLRTVNGFMSNTFDASSTGFKYFFIDNIQNAPSPSTNTRIKSIVGKRLGVRILRPNVPLMPSIPAFKKSTIWAEVGDISADFAGFEISTQTLLESVSSRTTRIITRYESYLEDLDNSFVYGADGDGNPIVWRVLSTSRIENDRYIQIQLVSQAVS